MGRAKERGGRSGRVRTSAAVATALYDDGLAARTPLDGAAVLVDHLWLPHRVAPLVDHHAAAALDHDHVRLHH